MAFCLYRVLVCKKRFSTSYNMSATNNRFWNLQYQTCLLTQSTNRLLLAPTIEKPIKNCTLDKKYKPVNFETPESKFCMIWLGTEPWFQASKYCSEQNATLPQPRSAEEVQIFQENFQVLKSRAPSPSYYSSGKIWLDMRYKAKTERVWYILSWYSKLPISSKI